MRVRGHGNRARAIGRGEATHAGTRRWRKRRAFCTRSESRGAFAACKHRPAAERWRCRRSSVLHDAVRARRVAPRASCARSAAGCRSGEHLARYGACACLRAWRRNRAPRHQARERAVVGRRGDGGGLWHREGRERGAHRRRRRQCHAHAGGWITRNSDVHGARAGVGRSRHRSSCGSLRVGCCGVRVACRSAPVCQPHVGACAHNGAPDRVARTTGRAADRFTGGPRRHRDAVPREGSRASAAVGKGTARGAGRHLDAGVDHAAWAHIK